MTPEYDTVAWFQIGSPDPDAAQRFYGELFGWTARHDPTSGASYRLLTARDAQAPTGGITAIDDADTAYATFAVLVRDVAAVCTRATELGGKVLVAPATVPSGLESAELLDTDGNRFVVFTPPAR
ncbi:VOC family protein [Nocardia terpenica]|uniref:Glyoxalase n=1 Tax=Nocardia terpenica TaxID=455432 RepID=A0A291RM46_9NOCA|nr:VOC family protein [Nocardia terpenica]ATL68378.1 glyoxalase [Nocardia terpenica]